MSLTAAMGCARETPAPRRVSDFYPTPADCTVALLRVELDHLVGAGTLWECAVGDGAILRVLQDAGLPCVGSDLVDRGCGAEIRNFFDFDEPLGSAIVTNPPYGSDAPVKFVQHALSLRVTYVAMLLKANFWNAGTRLPLFEQWPPAAIYPLAFRPDFTGEKSSPMDMSWYVWDARRKSQVFRPLARPDTTEVRVLRADHPLFMEAAE